MEVSQGMDKNEKRELNLFEAIRMRPGMYVGDTSIFGVCNLLCSLTEEALEHINKRTDRKNNFIEVRLDENTFTFTCNFFDIKNKLQPEIIKALSDIFEIITENEHSIYNKGVLVSKKDSAIDSLDLLRIIFRPDKTVFSYENIEYYMIFNYIKRFAQLNRHITFSLISSKNTNIFHFENGLKALLIESIFIYTGLIYNNIITIEFNDNDINVSVAMVYGFAEDVKLSYVNNVRTYDGGEHVQGLYDGILLAFDNYIENNISITKQDAFSKLNFVIHVKLGNPKFYGAVRRKLTNVEVKHVVKNGIATKLLGMLQNGQQLILV